MVKFWSKMANIQSNQYTIEHFYEFDGIYDVCFDQHFTIYTVVDKESESEVQKYEILEPGGEK